MTVPEADDAVSAIHVDAAWLDWAIRHLLRFGDSDLLPVPFEYHAINAAWSSSARAFLLRQNVMTWACHEPQDLLVQKSRTGFRVGSRLDPFDCLLFTALVGSVAVQIEARRPSLLRGVVFSNRVSALADGTLFRTDVGYAQYSRRAQEACATNQDGYVIVADIADFYYRIGIHRLQHALTNVVGDTLHVRAIIRFLTDWNQRGSVGLPVGSQPTALLAEALLAEVDALMLAKGIRFIRFVDDYRIFARDKDEARRLFAQFAELLYQSQRLTLNASKTDILTVAEFESNYLSGPESRVKTRLKSSFEVIMNLLGVESPYDMPAYEDLDDDTRRAVDALNLHEIILEQAEAPEVDVGLCRFCLALMTHLGYHEAMMDVVALCEKAPALLPKTVQYCSRVAMVDADEAARGATALLKSAMDGSLSHLEYAKVWALECVIQVGGTAAQNDVIRAFDQSSNALVRSLALRAAARLGQAHWIQTQVAGFVDRGTWEKRGLLAALECLPVDAMRSARRVLRSRLGELELIVLGLATPSPAG